MNMGFVCRILVFLPKFSDSMLFPTTNDRCLIHFRGLKLLIRVDLPGGSQVFTTYSNERFTRYHQIGK